MRGLAVESAVAGAVVVVIVLLLLEFRVDDVRFIDHDAVEEPLELLDIDTA